MSYDGPLQDPKVNLEMLIDYFIKLHFIMYLIQNLLKLQYLLINHNILYLLL